MMDDNDADAGAPPATSHADPMAGGAEENAAPAAPPSSAGGGGSREGTGASIGLDDDEDDGASPFKFAVVEPRMALPDRAIDLAYWIYHVVTKTTMDEWEKKELKVPHRFSDFTWLQDQLVQEYPGVLVPPTPEASAQGALEKVHLKDTALLNYRQRALTKFLNAVGRHPTLQKSKLLKGFCEMDGKKFEEFQKEVKAARAAEGPSAASGVMKAAKEGFFKFRGKDKAAGGGAAARGSERLEQRKALAESTEKAMRDAQEKLQKQVQSRREIQAVMADVGAAMTRCGDLESRTDKGLGGDFTVLGVYSESLAKLYASQADKEEKLVLEQLKYYTGCYKGIKEAVARLLKLEVTMLTFQGDLESAEAAIAKAKDKGKAEKNRDDRKTDYEKAKEKFDKAVEVFDQEWDTFHKTKFKDLKNVQMTMVKQQVSYAKQMEQLTHPAIEDPTFDD